VQHCYRPSGRTCAESAATVKCDDNHQNQSHALDNVCDYLLNHKH
jgi:hypothetical protein